MRHMMTRVFMVSALSAAPLSFAGSAEPAPAVKAPVKPRPANGARPTNAAPRPGGGSRPGLTAPMVPREITDEDIDMFVKWSVESSVIRKNQGDSMRVFVESLKKVPLKERPQRYMDFQKKHLEEGIALQRGVNEKYPVDFK